MASIKYTVSLPGHNCSLQGSSSLFEPGHSDPPSHVRVLVPSPAPQLLLHVLKGLHSDHDPECEM